MRITFSKTFSQYVQSFTNTQQAQMNSYIKSSYHRLLVVSSQLADTLECNAHSCSNIIFIDVAWFEYIRAIFLIQKSHI